MIIKNNRRKVVMLSIIYLHIIYTIIVYRYINSKFIDNIGITMISLYSLLLIAIIYKIIFNMISTWRVISAIAISILCTLCIHCANAALIYIFSNAPELAISNIFIACIIGFVAYLSLMTRV